MTWSRLRQGRLILHKYELSEPGEGARSRLMAQAVGRRAAERIGVMPCHYIIVTNFGAYVIQALVRLSLQ